MSDPIYCKHDLTDIDAAINADGLCPICQSQRLIEQRLELDRLRAELASVSDSAKRAHEDWTEAHLECEDLRAELAEAKTCPDNLREEHESVAAYAKRATAELAAKDGIIATNFAGAELREKLEKPLNFQWETGGAELAAMTERAEKAEDTIGDQTDLEKDLADCRAELAEAKARVAELEANAVETELEWSKLCAERERAIEAASLVTAQECGFYACSCPELLARAEQAEAQLAAMRTEKTTAIAQQAAALAEVEAELAEAEAWNDNARDIHDGLLRVRHELERELAAKDARIAAITQALETSCANVTNRDARIAELEDKLSTAVWSRDHERADNGALCLRAEAEIANLKRRCEVHARVVAFIERVAAEQSSDPATDDLTVPLALELVETDNCRARAEQAEARLGGYLEVLARAERAEARVAELEATILHWTSEVARLERNCDDDQDRAERAEARVAELEEQLKITKGINAMRYDLTDSGAQERRMERLADRMRDEKHKETLGTELSGALDLAARAERAEDALKEQLQWKKSYTERAERAEARVAELEANAVETELEWSKLCAERERAMRARAEAERDDMLEVCVGVDKVASIEEEIGFSKDWTPMWRDTVTRARAALNPSPAGRCPRCNSPSPERHPAVQFEGEVQMCPHPFHAPSSAGREG